MTRNTRHRILAALTTSALALTGVVLSGGPASAATTVYTASAGFSGTQGVNQWRYQKLAGSTYTNLPAYVPGTAHWEDSTNSYPWIGAGQAHPDNAAAVVRTWTAPSPGTVTVSGAVHKGDALGDGVIASVRKNNSVLWSATVVNTTDVNPSGVSGIPVAAGDRIQFVVDKNGNMDNDHTFWNPAVSFTSSSAQPGNSLAVTAYGAVANDGLDDLAAFNAAVSAARSQGKTVWVPEGTFQLSGVLTLDSVKLAGAGMTATTLVSTNAGAGAILLKNTAPGLSFLRHEYQSVVPRDGDPLKQNVMIEDASGWRVEGVWAVKASTGGILAFHSTDGVVTGNVVQDTNADAIHMTGASSYVTITNNVTLNAGDDLYAVVSYSGDSGPTHHITIQDNSGAVGAARGISVVGGTDVTITGNMVKDTQMAGSYVAVEHNPNFNTQDVQRVTLSGNTFEHGGIREPDDHPNVLVVADTGGLIDEINYTGNWFKDAAHDGVGVRGTGNVQDVYFTSNLLTGSGGNPTQFAPGVGVLHISNNTGF